MSTKNIWLAESMLDIFTENRLVLNFLMDMIYTTNQMKLYKVLFYFDFFIWKNE